jgi:uncharacterized membrane protein
MDTPHSKVIRTFTSVFLVGACAIGVILRLTRLTRANVWTDEVVALLRLSGTGLTQFVAELFHGRVVTTSQVLSYQSVGPQSTLTGVIASLRLEESEQAPLFTILTHYAGSLGFSSVVSIRVVSALASVATVALSGWLAYVLVRSSRAALITAALVACSPLQVLLAREGRCYALWVLFVLLGTLMLDRATQENRFRDWVFYTCACILSLYTHPLTLLLFPGHALFIALRNSRVRGLLVPGALSLGVATSAFVPWLMLTLASWNDAVASGGKVAYSTAGRLLLVARGLFSLLARSLAELLRYNDNWKLSQAYLIQVVLWVGLVVVVVTIVALSMVVRRDRSRLAILPTLSMMVGLVLIDLATGTDRSQVLRYLLPCITSFLVLIGIVVVDSDGERSAPKRAARALDTLQAVLRRAQFPAILILCGLVSSIIQSSANLNWLNGSVSTETAMADALQVSIRAGRLPTVRACQGSSMEVLILSHQLDPRVNWELTREPCRLGLGDSMATHVLSSNGFAEYPAVVQVRLRSQAIVSAADQRLQMARL